MTVRRQAIVAIALGGAALIAMGLSHLALTDIAHGEPNPVAEWRVLQIGFGVIFVALIAAVATLVRVVRAKA